MRIPRILVTVVVLICLLFFLIVPKMGSNHSATMAATYSDMASIKTALEAYQIDTGGFPTGTNALQNLLRPSTGVTNWHGPYLDSLPKDPWGHEYIYTIPGKNPTPNYPYDLCSPGPHGNNPIYAHPPHIMTLK